MSQLLPSFLRGSAPDKKARAMTVEDIKAELEGSSKVSDATRDVELSALPSVLRLLHVAGSDYAATVAALAAAGVKNIDDLMLTARFVELNEAGTLEKLRKAGLGDAMFLGKLIAFADVSGVKATVGKLTLPAAATTAATTTTLDGTATPAGTTPSHSPPPRMTHAH